MFLFGRKNGASAQTKKTPPPVGPSDELSRRGKSWLSLSFAMQGNIRSIESWLCNHCIGEWNIVIEGMARDLRSKEIRVNFDRDEDRQRFKSAFFAASPSR